MPAEFLVTFDTVTPESAENGDVESMGYAHPNGGKDDLAIVSSEEVRLYAWPLASVRRRFGKGADDGGRSFHFHGHAEDARTGAVTTYTLHIPATVTPSSYRRLARVFGARN